ncbi:MAG TPA: hypothetical protein VMZ29_01365 [Candidatus Bathyarchaeia archaeon]|nr:hypothetical protein [Candidatus Bathyarchaeia archaeon]
MAEKLFLEPHYGDIAWSCSGLVALYKEETLIVNLFPPKRKFYRLKFKGIIYRRKKREEKDFSKLFGIRILYLKYKSAFLRGRSIETLFDKEFNKLEEKIVIQLYQDIIKLIDKEKVSEIYCPKAQRNQIDHLIVKAAVARIVATDCKIFYYEDFPNFLPDSKIIDKETDLEKMKVNIQEVIEEKIQAVHIYQSLIKPYFKSEESLVELIRKTPYETFWKEK